MGYRALLKNYLRHLMRTAGTHHLDTAARTAILSKRDIAELRLLVAEASREDERRGRNAADEPDYEWITRPGND
jgi:hypothetical protein